MNIKCDRCGETFDLRDYTMLSNIQMIVSSIGCPQEYEFNLCPSCMDDVAFDRMRKMQYEKEVRWLSRLEAKEQSDE